MMETNQQLASLGPSGYEMEGASAAHSEFSEIFRYEVLDSEQLAERLNLPESWIRDQVRSRAEDPLPHAQFGKYVRFLWGSPELEAWLRRRIIVPNNKRVGRVN